MISNIMNLLLIAFPFLIILAYALVNQRQPPRPLTWRTLVLIGGTALLFGSLLAVTQTGHLEPFAWRRALAWSLVLFLLTLAFEAVLRWRPGASDRR